MGAWIEIYVDYNPLGKALVAPHMGAWIEMMSIAVRTKDEKVAPHMGAWIEMFNSMKASASNLSHPTWVRGLKFTWITIRLGRR